MTWRLVIRRPGNCTPLPPRYAPGWGSCLGCFRASQELPPWFYKDVWKALSICGMVLHHAWISRCAAMCIFLKQLSVFQYFRPFLVMPEGSKYNPDRPVVQCLIITPNHLAWDCYTVLMVYFALKLCQFGLCTCLFRAANCGFVRE